MMKLCGFKICVSRHKLITNFKNHLRAHCDKCIKGVQVIDFDCIIIFYRSRSNILRHRKNIRSPTFSTFIFDNLCGHHIVYLCAIIYLYAITLKK